MISIIIPIYNASKYIKNCLEHISHLDYKDYEVIIVDDASIDDSLTIAKQMGFDVISSEQTRGPAVARNLGVKKSKGDILFFVDSDVYLNPGTLNRINFLINSYPKIAGVVFVYSLEHPNKSLVSLYKNFSIRTEEMEKPDLTSGFRFSAFAMKKEAFDKIGGFNGNVSFSCEEMEFSFRVNEHNLVFYIDKELNVIHAKCCTFMELVIGDFQRALIYFSILLKNCKRIKNSFSQIKGAIHMPVAQLLSVGFAGLFFIFSFFFARKTNLLLFFFVLIVLVVSQRRFIKMAINAYGFFFAMFAFLMRNLEIAIGETAMIAAVILYCFKRGRP